MSSVEMAASRASSLATQFSAPSLEGLQCNFRSMRAKMIDWSSCPAVERDPERVSGAWLFRDTRVPVSALFENLESGADISRFVNWFPGVSPEQVRQVLEHTAKSALAPA